MKNSSFIKNLFNKLLVISKKNYIEISKEDHQQLFLGLHSAVSSIKYAQKNHNEKPNLHLASCQMIQIMQYGYKGSKQNGA